MKKGTFIIGVLFLILFLSGQEIQEQAIAINIEVPVRVFTKGKFVEELNLDDFEIYEDGVLQKIEALYLVKKTVIEREETELDKKTARRIFLPEVSRTFVLVFEMMDYFPQIDETLEYFFENVFLPDDSLLVVTPKKTYSLKKEFLDKASKEMIVKQLKANLMRDIRLAGRELKSMTRELEWYSIQMKNARDVDIGTAAMAASTTLRKIRDYRYFDEKKLMGFKEQLKDIEGQKYVFLFYQKNIIPVPPEISVPSDVERPPIPFSVERVKKAFSDSLITINFIFVTKTDQYNLDGERMNPAEQHPDQDPSTWGLQLIDQSEEIFGAFHEMADATGGITDSSANMAASFERAAIASENYYLLYYTPKDYKSDGKFKAIKVRIKGKNYSVTHRAGYIAEDFHSGQVVETGSIEKNFNSIISGLEKYREGDLEGAIEAYSEVIRTAPQNALAYYNRGIVYEGLGDISHAFEDYTKAVEINPDYAEAYNNRGCLLVDDREYEQAIKDFTNAIRVKPDYASAYFNRGGAWRGLREYRKAIQDFKRAVELDPAKMGRALEEIKFCEARIKDI